MRQRIIDSLPKAQQKEIFDALLAGVSLRRVAKLVGCTHTVIEDYKNQVFLPAVRSAQKLNELEGVGDKPVQATEVQRAMTTVEPLRQRIVEHRKVVDEKLLKASPAGAAALISADLRGIELEAKLAGTLQPQHGDVVFQNVILMPKTVRPAGFSEGHSPETLKVINVDSKDVTE